MSMNHPKTTRQPPRRSHAQGTKRPDHTQAPELPENGALCALTDEEVDRLIYITTTGAGQDGPTEAEIGQVIEWAKKVRIQHALLDSALRGQLIPGEFCDGDLVFRAAEEVLPPAKVAELQRGLQRLEGLRRLSPQGRRQ
jgi:hypothetical protein